MTDVRALVEALASTAPEAPLRLRQGVIQSVQGSSVTVTVGGSTTALSGVHYASHACPIPGATCWLATDGRDWMVFATLAPNGPAYGSMRQNAAQSIPDSTWREYNFGTRTDTVSNGVTLGSNGLTIVVPGLYQVTASADFAANSTGQRHSRLVVNGSAAIEGTGGDRAAGGDIMRLRADGILKLAAGDVVNVSVYQSSTAALNTSIGAGTGILRATWLGPTA